MNHHTGNEGVTFTSGLVTSPLLVELGFAHGYDDWAGSTEKPSERGKLRPFPGRLRATAERSFEAGHAGPHTDQWEQSTTASSSGLGLHQAGCA